MEPINFQDGKFVVTAAQAAKFRELALKALVSNDPQEHYALAETILAPISTVAEYTEWLDGILQPQSRDMSDVIRVALDSPTVIGYSTSPTGAPSFTFDGVS